MACGPGLVVDTEKVEAVRVLDSGDPVERKALKRAVVALGLGDKVASRADVVGECDAGEGSDAWDELDARRAVPDHGNALALELDVRVPAQVVEVRPGERLDARDIGQLGLGERPGSRHEHLSFELELVARHGVLHKHGVRLRVAVPPRANVLRVEGKLSRSPCLSTRPSQ
jgi:hypothetical protein